MNKTKTLRDWGEVYSQLSALKDLSGAKLAYAIAKNKKTILNELEALNEASKPSEEYTKYDRLRVELAKKYAKKDKDGKPLTEGNVYVMEDYQAFDKEHKELEKEHKKAIDERNKQKEELEEVLDQEKKLTLWPLKKEDLPEEITVEQLEALIDFIVD